MFGNLDDQFSPPASELRNFTNRVGEQAAFQRLLDLDGPHFSPVLMFRGAGLLGNTWEFLVEFASAATSEIPGAGLFKWLILKATSPVSA